MSEAKEAYEAGERYRGFILYAEDSEGKFWVVGEERWMSEEEIDQMIAERAEVGAE
jgi:hypothetical protein